MSNLPNPAPGKPLLDRSDVRVKHASGVRGTLSAFYDRVRSGDLGSLPVVVGLIIIWTVEEERRERPVAQHRRFCAQLHLRR